MIADDFIPSRDLDTTASVVTNDWLTIRIVFSVYLLYVRSGASDELKQFKNIVIYDESTISPRRAYWKHVIILLFFSFRHAFFSVDALFSWPIF